MSSQETVHVSLFVGNTDSRQRDSGHLVVSTSAWVAGLIKPAQSPDAGLETRLGANQERKRAYTNQRLNPCEPGKAHGRKPGFQTGPGKSGRPGL
jgi:hypothetical protein